MSIDADAQFVEKAAFAIGDRYRLAILQEIAQQGEICCLQVQDLTGLAQATCSHHLKLLAESDLVLSRKEGMQKNAEPVAMTETQIQTAITEFTEAARLGVEEAGFDGVELHGANGYLLEQFLHPASNERTDHYGGAAVSCWK